MSIESLYCLWCLLRVFPGEFLLGGSRRRNRRLSATVVDPTDYGAPGCLAGTAGAKPRCTALEGVIGGQVHCRIYAQRPSVCRDFTMAWENGEANQHPEVNGDSVTRLVHRSRDHVEQGAAQKRSRRQGNQRQNELFEGGLLEYQRYAANEGDTAHHDAAAHNPIEDAHRTPRSIFTKACEIK